MATVSQDKNGEWTISGLYIKENARVRITIYFNETKPYTLIVSNTKSKSAKTGWISTIVENEEDWATFGDKLTATSETTKSGKVNYKIDKIELKMKDKEWDPIVIQTT